MYNKAQQRTTMHSHAWMNRQSQQAEPSQSSQNASQFTFRNTSDWLKAAVSSQHPVRGEQTNTFPYGFDCNAQTGGNSSSSGNLHLLATNRSDYHQTCSLINSPNMVKANAQVTGNRKQARRTQRADVVSYFQHFRFQENVLQKVSVEPVKPVSAYNTRASSHPHQQVAGTFRLQSASARIRDHSDRQNDMQPRCSPSFSPTSNDQAASHSLTNNNISTNPPPYHQAALVSNPSCKAQQYQTHFISRLNTGNAATYFSNSNSYSCQYENRPTLPSTHKPPLNPVVDTAEQVIQRIAQDLRQSFPPGMGSHPSVYTAQQVHQNMQPMTSAPNQNYNCVFQASSVNCGVSLPKSTYSIISGTQHSAGAPPQGNYGTATAAKSVNEDRDRSTLSHRRIHKGPIESYYAAKINSEHCESETSPSAVAKGQEMIEKLFSGNANDGSIHSTPGNTGTRAVAVVQPLPLESNQFFNACASPDGINQSTEDAAKDESLSLPGKLWLSPEVARNSNGSNRDLEYLNQRIPNKSLISHSAMSADDDGNQDLSQKQLCADDTGSELDVNMHIDHSVAPTVQQSGEGTDAVCTCCDEDKSKNAADTKACGHELDSVPTHQWTVATLSDYILKARKAQMSISNNCNLPPFSLERLLEMFWDSDLRNVLSLVKAGIYKDLICEINDFCKKHVTLNSVVFSQVIPQCAKQLKWFHFLEDGEDYVEPSYRSSWLNVNEQLDDIDKEFGFQCSFRHYLHKLERSSQLDQVSTPAEIVDEVSNEVFSETELEPVDSREDKQPSAVEAATSTQNASPDTAELPDSSDPYYSFQIEVLPPEEAKVIYEHGLNKMPQSIETDSEPEEDTNSHVDNDKSSVIDTLLIESTERSNLICPIEDICCLKRLLEVNWESGKPPSLKCDCQEYQSHGNSDDSAADRENMCVNRPDDILYNATEGENKADNGKNVNIQSSTSERKFDEQTLDFEKDPELPKAKLTESNLSDDSGTEKTSSSDSEIPSGPEMDCDKEMCETGGSMQCCTPVSPGKSEDLTGSESDDSSQTSGLAGNCEKAQLTSIHERTSSMETEEQSKVSVKAAFDSKLSIIGKNKTKKPKIRSSAETFSPFSKKSKNYPADINPQAKRRKALCGINEYKPSDPEVKTVKLALFGSAAQRKDGSIGRKFRHTLPYPPEVLSITCSPIAGKPSQSVPTVSIKKVIHQKWLLSFPPTVNTRKNKLTRRKNAFPKATLKKSGPAPTAQWSYHLF